MFIIYNYAIIKSTKLHVIKIQSIKHLKGILTQIFSILTQNIIINRKTAFYTTARDWKPNKI